MEEMEFKEPSSRPEMPKDLHRLGKREIGLIIFVVVAIIGVAMYTMWVGRNKQASINSFGECVAAGNPVMESYPEQCAANGQTWANPAQAAPVFPEN